MNKIIMISVLILLYAFSYSQEIPINKDFSFKNGFNDINIESNSTIQSDTLNKLEVYYLTNNINHRIKVMKTQHIISIVIFCAVLLIVFGGLFFAGKHFYAFLSHKTLKADTELEISTKGIKINSSVIGLIILIISIVFFYLYLVFVYPIKEIQTDKMINYETLTKNIVHLADSANNEDGSNK